MISKEQYWLNIAQEDISAAKLLFNGGKYLHVGFICHQAVEKGLKAIISAVEKDAIPPKIHDLVKLATRADIYSKMSEKQKNLLDVLLPLNIEARYPAYKDNVAASLDESKCRQIFEETEAMLEWIKQQL